ncbi:hypothetical protein P692DRAFT_20829558 [Suillus brevipes Sb2]|nr:hypothetical protein P692DRAFT_20829558 [Suillus brevipes Sb2]
MLIHSTGLKVEKLSSSKSRARATCSYRARTAARGLGRPTKKRDARVVHGRNRDGCCLESSSTELLENWSNLET